MLNRRRLLHLLSMSGAAFFLPQLSFAEAKDDLQASSGFPRQSQIDNDPLRPRYHLMPRRGWMNDPCAPVFFGGRYHLFYQYNPDASVWGDMHWAHVVSQDMVHWTERPIALAPVPGGPDSFGAFTGSMVIDSASGRPVPKIIYTCVSPSTASLSTLSYSSPPEREQQCLAIPTSLSAPNADAKLDIWLKEGVVVPSPPPELHVTGFRDPTPWREGNSWYMLLASGEYRRGGNVLLYQSTDLEHWDYVKIFAQGKWTGSEEKDTVNTGEMWECPDFFPLGTKHILIHSTGTANGRKTFWQAGTLDKQTMEWVPQAEGILNHGPYYAPKTQTDAEGNRILWGWIPEDRPEAVFGKAGWAGCMSLPRVLSLQEGQLRFLPAIQVNTLRESSAAILPPASQQWPSQYELVLTVSRKKPAKEISIAGKTLAIVSGNVGLQWNGEEIYFPDPLPEDFTVRAFVDHSVLELFVGDLVVLTARVYSDSQPARLVLPQEYAVEKAELFSCGLRRAG